jgi:nucleotide-binding universal stress UspA family protein
VDRLLIGSTTESLLDRLPASLLVVPVAGRTSRRSRAPL